MIIHHIRQLTALSRYGNLIRIGRSEKWETVAAADIQCKESALLPLDYTMLELFK